MLTSQSAHGKWTNTRVIMDVDPEINDIEISAPHEVRVIEFLLYDYGDG